MMMCNAFISGYQIQDKCTLKIKLKKKNRDLSTPCNELKKISKDLNVNSGKNRNRWSSEKICPGQGYMFAVLKCDSVRLRLRAENNCLS